MKSVESMSLHAEYGLEGGGNEVYQRADRFCAFPRRRRELNRWFYAPKVYVRVVKM